MGNNPGGKGYMLLEVLAATAILAITALSISAALITATSVAGTARAITRGRLLAQSHLEQAAGGNAPLRLDWGNLSSTLKCLEQDGCVLWEVVVQGPDLPCPLKVVGGP